jgi:hypothetical protein
VHCACAVVPENLLSASVLLDDQEPLASEFVSVTIEGEKYVHDSGEKISSLHCSDQKFLVETYFTYTTPEKLSNSTEPPNQLWAALHCTMRKGGN